MRVVIAIDSMKGSLDSLQAGRGAEAGILRVNRLAFRLSRADVERENL